MLFKGKLKKESVHITFGSSADDNEYYMEFRVKSVEKTPFLSLFSTKESIHINAYGANNSIPLQDYVNQLEKANDAVVLNTEHGQYKMNTVEFEDLLSSSAQRLLKAKAEYLKVLKQHPEWDL